MGESGGGGTHPATSDRQFRGPSKGSPRPLPTIHTRQPDITGPPPPSKACPTSRGPHSVYYCSFVQPPYVKVQPVPRDLHPFALPSGDTVSRRPLQLTAPQTLGDNIVAPPPARQQTSLVSSVGLVTLITVATCQADPTGSPGSRKEWLHALGLNFWHTVDPQNDSL